VAGEPLTAIGSAFPGIEVLRARLDLPDRAPPRGAGEIALPDGGATQSLSPGRTTTAAEEVLRAARERGGLPAAGPAIARLTRLLASDSEAVHALADAILADASLTQRLLHLANTMPYRTGTPPVTTVTRAILLLGVDRVKAAALSLLLLDGVVGADAPRVYADFRQALLASSLAPLLLGTAAAEQAEIACIAALFRNVGRMLLAVYAPQALAAVRDGQDARSVVGCSLEELTTQLLRQWSLPERLVLATQPLPARIDAATVDPIRAAAHFADAVAETLRAAGGCASEAALRQVRERFAPALLVEDGAFAAAIEAATERARQFERAAGIDREGERKANDAAPVGALPEDEDTPSAERDPVGRPLNAMAVLLAGLADATDALARGTESSTVVDLVLETIYNGLGYARVVLVLRDGAAGTLRVRTGFGQPRPQFTLPAHGTDLFSAALAKTTDLHIADAAAEKIRNRLPPWFAQQCAATKSFLLMPIATAGRAAGLLYAERRVVDAGGPSAEELRVLRALRSQIALALRSGSRI
jgi:HD-like signal output (HDOD) protein